MASPSRKILPLLAVPAAVLLSHLSYTTSAVEVGGQRREDALARQSRALVEQDLAVVLAALGRNEEAFAHYRTAVGLDPWLRAPWVALAARALETGSPERAAHFAAVAAAIAPQDELAAQLLERAQSEMPRGEPARRAADLDCEARPERPDPDGGLKAGTRRECLERRAGLFADTSQGAGGALRDLARLDLAEGKPESAALMLTMAGTVGAGDPALLSKALSASGHPCEAARQSGAEASLGTSCAAREKRRALIERDLHDELAGLSSADRVIAEGRIENFLAADLEPTEVARRWRMDWRQGQRPHIDLGGLTLRLGEEWYESGDEGSDVEVVWRRRPGDSAVAVFVLPAEASGVEASLRRVLASRRPAPLAWSSATAASTDPVRVRMSPLAVDADSGGRAEGYLWLAESASFPGAALAIVAYPGTGGLGAEGLEQSRAEILQAMTEAVLVPSRWPALPTLEADEEFPVPVAGGRTARGDEQAAPWRTYPAGEFTLALPPGSVAAIPIGAPGRSAPRRASAVLWFRGRFRDRDGADVAVGDETRSGSVDVTTSPSLDDAVDRVLSRTPAPPLSDPGAVLVSTLDMSRTLGAETGAAAASIARFRPSSPGVEWLVCRLAFPMRLVEIDVPAVTGASSIALYWIPSTVRPVHGPPPPAPVDLSGRLGIAFLRPGPSERSESFYKEGDLRSRELTMIVARGYTVVLDTTSPDSFPVRLTHTDGGAIVRLEKVPRDPALVGIPGTDALQSRLESSVRAWLAREGFEIGGGLVRNEGFKWSRSGATAGLDVTFTAARRIRPGERSRSVAESASQDSARENAAPVPESPAKGRALLLWSREGEAFVLLSLFWDTDSEHRMREIDLMSGSLRLIRQSGGPRK